MKSALSGLPAAGARIGTCAAIMLSLAACVTVIRGDGNTEGSAKREMLQYAASRGPVYLEMKGDTPELPEVHRRMAAAASGALQDMDLVFTADRGQAGIPDYRFVLAFNPAARVTERDLCEGGPAWVRRSEGETRLITSFCAGESLIASSITTAPQVSGPDDPVLGEMIRAGVAETIRGRATLGGPRP
ncbi:hypothetical protein NUH88_19515 [Nisaea acidiphila]|uniref:Lipoprotein n=1 Tax=Nisaea acidiphila TaxID=1862145 RepID=A0A9J7AQR4_9PROT|nr:hypothetical protein [Nisaea acidiphila]UUX49575.1 hypothetical protein NUH88_19515 [Nisaea acidiphila]